MYNSTKDTPIDIIGGWLAVIVFMIILLVRKFVYKFSKVGVLLLCLLLLALGCFTILTICAIQNYISHKIGWMIFDIIINGVNIFSIVSVMRGLKIILKEGV